MGGPVRGRVASIIVYGAKDAQSQLHRFEALIDTGATATTIKDSQAQALGLRMLRRQQFNTANGPVVLTVYAMHVIVGGRQQNLVLRKTIEVVGSTNLFGEMLYGMDMLSEGTLTMTLDAHGNGNWDWR